MTDGQPPPDKKDLTGIFAVPPASTSSSSEGTFAMPATETVESFDSIVPDMSLPEPSYQTTPTEAPPSDADTFPVTPIADEPTLAAEPAPAPTSDPLDDLRSYSHSAQGMSQYSQVFVPYHLYLSGNFGPYERDKLLLFITENDIGVSSQDLDLQIRASKVFFPRISEFAGIKLIQELRDSGLQFRFMPSERDPDESVNPSEGLEFHYRPAAADAKPLSPVPVIPENSRHLADYAEIDSIQMNQYLKADIVEVEKSDLFQEILDRMLEAMKQKVRIKGGDALGNVVQKITPLRLPSQYQIMVQAAVLKKR